MNLILCNTLNILWYIMRMNKKKYKPLTKGEQDIIKKRNKFILNKVREWQDFPYVKPLVCKNCAHSPKLEPKATRFKVILRCPECDTVQYYIPKPILQTRLKRPKVLIRNQDRYGSLVRAIASDDEET